jgi:hypothetical protein
MAVNFNVKFESFIVDRAGYDYTFNSPVGPVGRHMSGKGRAMVVGAKSMVNVRTGRLKNSIHARVGRSPLGPLLEVGTTGVPYATAVHQGTSPHVITPNSQSILRFSSGGRIIYTHKVDHPGTRANKFLTSQMYLVRL